MSKRVVTDPGVKALFSWKESLWTSFYTSSLELKVPSVSNQSFDPTQIHLSLFILLAFKLNCWPGQNFCEKVIQWRTCDKNPCKFCPVMVTWGWLFKVNICCVFCCRISSTVRLIEFSALYPTSRASKFAHFRVWKCIFFSNVCFFETLFFKSVFFQKCSFLSKSIRPSVH